MSDVHGDAGEKASKTGLVVFGVEQYTRSPILFVRERVREIWHARELIVQFFLRDLRARYRQSLLGYLWAVIPPIATAVGFTLAAESRILAVGTTSFAYPAFVLFSTVLWQSFLDALHAPMSAVVEARPLLSKVRFPPEVFVLSKCGECAVHLLIRLALVGFAFSIYGVPIGWLTGAAFGGLILLLLLGLSIGLCLAPLEALYQDTSRAVMVFSTFWFMITPIVYPVPQSGVFSSIVKLNPVTPLLVTTRELAVGAIPSEPKNFLLVSLCTVGGFFFAWVLYRRAHPFIIERENG